MDTFNSEYWSTFEKLANRYPVGFTMPRKQDRYYIRLPASGFGFQRSALVNRTRKTIAIEMICEHGGKLSPEAKLKILETAVGRDVLNHYPGKLVWDSGPEMIRAKVWEEIDVAPEEKSDWAAQHAWLIGRLIALEIVLGPALRKLAADI